MFDLDSQLPTTELNPADTGSATLVAQGSGVRRARRLPDWLRRPLGGGAAYARTERAVEARSGTGRHLHTICEEARCPNRGECWSAGTATFMILGAHCTRRCGFCSVQGGRPAGELDGEEPERLAEAIATMGLRYVVITSVNRDDLADGGAAHFAACMQAVRRRSPGIALELLTPDFRRKQEIAHTVLTAEAPFIWGHNVETVPRLYRRVRPGSAYDDSLALLRRAAATPRVIAKSSLMLGLGERREEVLAVLDDLAAAGVRRVTLGQYLQPSPAQLPVEDFVHPDAFADYAEAARDRGFTWVIAEPFARSSYHAELDPPQTDPAEPRSAVEPSAAEVHPR